MCTAVVGIDLAGVESRPTGFCILKGLNAETNELFTNEDLKQKTLCAQPALIAIDAPLYLPPGRKNLTCPKGNHLRESDRALLKMGIKILPPTLGPMRKLTARGIELRVYFEQRDFRVIEAYPGGAQDILGIPRKKSGVPLLRAGLTKLGIQGLNGVESDHELDAATAAYIGKLYLEGNADIFGDLNQGIVLPKKREEK
jgi:predicted nuclease with RNAse H fold